jgi:hypothetical protein
MARVDPWPHSGDALDSRNPFPSGIAFRRAGSPNLSDPRVLISVSADVTS